MPCRFRTEMCQDGAACQHPLCVHAHSLSELQPSEIQKSIQTPQQVTFCTSSACGAIINFDNCCTLLQQ